MGEGKGEGKGQKPRYMGLVRRMRGRLGRMFGKLGLVGATSVVICRRKTRGEGIIGEGNRAQGTEHNSRLIPGIHSLLGGQGCWVSENQPKFFHSAQESNPGILGWEPSVLTTAPRSPQEWVEGEYLDKAMKLWGT